MAKQQEADNNSSVPLLAKFYIGLYNAVPRIYLPGTRLDIGFMMIWMIFFSLCRLAMLPILVHFGWSGDKVPTMDAAASLVGGMFHSPNVVPMTYVLMRSQNPFHPSGASKDSPKWWQDALEATLQICTGYMFYDAIFLCVARYRPGEGVVVDEDLILFGLHHFMTSFYMTTSRLYGAGQSSALMCIFLGEFTNPPFNAYSVLAYATQAGVPITGIWKTLEVPNEIVLALTYLPLRVVLGPIICGYMSYNLLCSKEGKAYIPIVVRLIWIFMMFGVIAGSIGHDFLFYDLLMKHMGFAKEAGHDVNAVPFEHAGESGQEL